MTGGYKDVRLARRANELFDRIVATGSVVLRRIGGDRGGELAAHRFLSHPDISPDLLLETFAVRTSAACAGRHVVAVQDTTEINFAGRDADRRDLGPAAGGKSTGFFIHPIIALDQATEAVLGIVDAHIWARPAQTRNRRRLPYEEKESARWLRMAESCAERLPEAKRIVVVGDRESDIHALFARRPASVELVVRAQHDRLCRNGERLSQIVAAQAPLGHMEVAIAARPGRKARVAQVVLRAARVEVLRPAESVDVDDAPSVMLTVVDVLEEAAPGGAKALHWRLLTTLDVPDLAAAREVVEIYRLRWRIEEVFRVLKRQGLDLPGTQVRRGESLFNLAALAIAAAARIVQLVDARDGSDRPATDVLDEELLPLVARISQSLEGKTQRQKNPHPPESLAWLAWVVARLGGWNCYYKPPGPKTMAEGWKQLAAMLAGAKLLA